MARRRKGRKDSIIELLFPIFTPSFPLTTPVIPAKAGIQRVGNGVCVPPLPLNSEFYSRES